MAVPIIELVQFFKRAVEQFGDLSLAVGKLQDLRLTRFFCSSCGSGLSPAILPRLAAIGSFEILG
eukprot:300311-Amphidinium_carterae.1